jgi:RNA polymerase sigma-70 factor (ECF subfamily)
MTLAIELPDADLAGPSPENYADLEALHREFYHRLVRLCARQLRDRSLAEDVAQDTILRALRFWGSYDADRPTWPWLKTIALRLCLDACRARSHEVCLEAMPEHAESTDRTERLLDEITVRRAMAGLPERQRLALRLRYFDDRDRDASAEVLGVNVNAFDQLLNRARLRLAHVIEPARAGASLGVLLLPLRWLRRRLSQHARTGAGAGAGGGLATVGMGLMSTVPLALAPLLAIVAGMTPAESASVDVSTHAYATPSGAATHAATTAPVASKTGVPVGRKAAPGGARQTVGVSAGAGPASADTSVSKHPLKPGRVESDRIKVETPAGTIDGGGYEDRNPTYSTLCGLPAVDCGP